MRVKCMVLVIGLLVLDGCSSDSWAELGTDTSDTSPSCRMGPLCHDGNDSCCASPRIPGGTVTLSDEYSLHTSWDPPTTGGYLEEYAADERPLDGVPLEVTVGDFRLDQYEVTVGRFRKFVEAYKQGWRPEAGAGSSPDGLVVGWDSAFVTALPATADELLAALDCDAVAATYRDAPGSYDNRPINCISFPLATAFCIWDEARLPSEQEWEYAAAGGKMERIVPWGNDFPPESKHASFSCEGDGDSSCMASDILSVGSFPDGKGRWGQSDLSGSMWEWTASVYTELYPATANTRASPKARTIRGGSWVDAPVHTRSAERDFAEPSHASYSIGVRCARD
jgi:formylglycine-generating enzyme